LTGFSHGAAGISWALLALAARTHEHRFRIAALGGLAYERSLFSVEAGNWPDLRESDRSRGQESSKPSPFLVAWCHGAPGIGLGRLRCRPFDVPAIDEEIAAALRTTLASGFGSNHCLCHGDLGNLDLLLEAAKAWPEGPWAQEAARRATSILNSIRRDGWLCGNPIAVESPGLMTGTAGIGYGLLRCAEPVNVPSILSLAPAIPRPTPVPKE
jgi:lantibiotic modifying enzyme